MFSRDELIDQITPGGTVTGTMPREQFHNGSRLIHPVIHLLLFDSSNRLLLQRRSQSKRFYPGCWDSSVSGHIQSGEYLFKAMQREAKEELGVSINKATPVTVQLIETPQERELSYFFCAGCSQQPATNPEEICEINYYQHNHLKKLLKNEPQTPALHFILNSPFFHFLSNSCLP